MPSGKDPSLSVGFALGQPTPSACGPSIVHHVRKTPLVPPSFSSTSCPTPFHPRNAVEMDTPSLSHRHQPTSIHEDRKGIGSVPNGNPPFQPTLAPGSEWERNRRREGEGMDRPDSSTAHAPETTDVRVRRGSP